MTEVKVRIKFYLSFTMPVTTNLGILEGSYCWRLFQSPNVEEQPTVCIECIF